MKRTALVLALACFATAAHAEPQAASEPSPMGFTTVAKALAGLKANKDVSFSDHNGWVIANDEEHMTIWSFTPKGLPAYPAVVKRQVTLKDGKYALNMVALCEADKDDCIKLEKAFENNNASMVDKLNNAK